MLVSGVIVSSIFPFYGLLSKYPLLIPASVPDISSSPKKAATWPAAGEKLDRERVLNNAGI